MSVEVPAELQPQIAAAIARGHYANEQELVSDILRVTVPVLDQYQQLRDDIRESLAEIEQGEPKPPTRFVSWLYFPVKTKDCRYVEFFSEFSCIVRWAMVNSLLFRWEATPANNF